MSDVILPNFRGLTWPVKRTPNFSTLVHRATSGKEVRLPLYASPLWDFELDFSVLTDSSAPNPGPTLSNLLKWSQNFLNSYWTLVGGTVTQTDAQVAPDGSLTAQVLTTGGGVGNTLSSPGPPGFPVTAGLAYTFSVYAMLGTGTNMQVKITWYNAANSVISTLSGPNAPPSATWGRLTLTGTAPAGAVTAAVSILSNNGTNGLTQFIWGAQFEQASTAQTYQPTNSTPLAPASELDTLVGLFIARQGQFDSFLFSNASDFTVVGQQFGIGDGTLTAFQLYLTRSATFPNGLETIQNPSGAPLIYINGVLKTPTTDYTISATGVVTFTTPPAANAVITWSGAFFYRVRFEQDAQEFDEFLFQVVEAKSVKLTGVFL